MKKLGFGCARLPLNDKNDRKSIDMEQFCRMADTFIENGFTYFDTAYMYHDGISESAIREAVVDRYPREKFMLADKLPVIFLNTKEDQERIFAEQLRKCNVDYFDIYLLHALSQNTYKTALRLKSFEFLQDLKKEGRVRHIGFSYHGDAGMLEEILGKYPEMEYVQLQLNYLDWENEIVQSRKCYEIAEKHKRKIIVMEPVKGGRLANIPEEAERILKNYNPNMSAASWAVRYAAGLNNVKIVLSGMSDYNQLEDNISYMQEFCALNEKEQEILSEIAGMIKKDVIIPCTKCHYCTTNCPKKIAIPEYFSLYDSVYRSYGRAVGAISAEESERITYEHYFLHNGKASDCIGCGQCERICPQHIPITKWLGEVAKCFENKQD